MEGAPASVGAPLDLLCVPLCPMHRARGFGGSSRYFQCQYSMFQNGPTMAGLLTMPSRLDL